MPSASRCSWLRLISAIFWNLLTWYLGFPSSSSHAMIGGFIGAVVMGAGWQAIKLHGLEKILIALFTSPIIGFVFGFIILQADLSALPGMPLRASMACSNAARSSQVWLWRSAMAPMMPRKRWALLPGPGYRRSNWILLPCHSGSLFCAPG